MKKALISRFGAYGDILHMSFLPKLLKEKEGYDVVDVETNHKGYQLLCHNPHIDNISVLEPSTVFQTIGILEKHWISISEGYDLFINLFRSLENNCLAMEDDYMYYQHEDLRREFGRGSYYDITLDISGLNKYKGEVKADVHYTDEEHESVKQFMGKYKDKFVVMFNLSGTGPHKRLVQIKEIVEAISEKFHDCFFITTGDKSNKPLDIEGDNVLSLIDKEVPFREALLISKYVDCVIGCESGLMVGANAWGTPTVQLMTAASIENHGGGMENDLSLQSPAPCSPCHKGPYKYIGCHKRDGNPVCIYFDVNDILDRVGVAYGVYTYGKS